MLNLRHLEHIDAVVRAGSLSAASESLGISAPALSKSIRSLENHLGTALFNRSGRVLTLTRFGREFTAEARRMLSLADHLESRAIAVASGDAGEIRIGTGPMAHQVMLPIALSCLSPDETRFRIDVTDAPWPELAEGLLDCTYDFVVADPDDLSQHTAYANFEVQPVAPMDLPLLVRPENPLATRSPLNMLDLVGARWVTPRIPDHYRERILDLAEASGISRADARAHVSRIPHIRIEDFNACLQIASKRDYVTGALRVLAQPYIDAGLLVPLQTPFMFTTQTAIISHKDRTRTRGAERLMQAVADAARELVDPDYVCCAGSVRSDSVV